jgi:hypothetical protein
MPLWNDPLDELIEELERNLPQPSRPAWQEPMPPLWHLCEGMQALLYGSEEEKKRTQPYLDEFVAYWAPRINR